LSQTTLLKQLLPTLLDAQRNQGPPATSTLIGITTKGSTLLHPCQGCDSQGHSTHKAVPQASASLNADQRKLANAGSTCGTPCPYRPEARPLLGQLKHLNSPRNPHNLPTSCQLFIDLTGRHTKHQHQLCRAFTVICNAGHHCCVICQHQYRCIHSHFCSPSNLSFLWNEGCDTPLRHLLLFKRHALGCWPWCCCQSSFEESSS